MPQEKYKRIDIATEQLCLAIELFLSERSYIGALTLAGAAEEILGKAVKHKGKESALAEDFYITKYYEKCYKKIRSEVFDEPTFKNDFFGGVNGARNIAKHWDTPLESEVEIDFVKSAKDMIIRACRNCDLLNIKSTDEILSFNHWFDEHET